MLSLLCASRSTAAGTNWLASAIVLAVACFPRVVEAQRQIPPFTRPTDALEFHRKEMEKLLAPVRKKLREKKIPFDPYISIEGDWRKKIDPALFALPEMKRNLRVTGPMKGIYLADTLLVGENVKLKGDTILIVKEFAPDDENRDFKISGNGNLFMFFVGDQKKIRPRRRRGEIAIETTGHCAAMGVSANGYFLHMKCRDQIGWTFRD
jgi:hypothetical protein